MATQDGTPPPKSGEWVTRNSIVVRCPLCDEDTDDIPLVWWDAAGERWKAYLSCKMCGDDAFGVEVTVEQLEEWGRLGGGWEELPLDPDDEPFPTA